jgi:hypothetical protein
MQDWDSTGVPPVQPAGVDVDTVLVWVLLDWQVPQPEYVNEVQVVDPVDPPGPAGMFAG